MAADKKKGDGKPIDDTDALSDASGTLTVKFLSDLENKGGKTLGWLDANWTKLSATQKAAVKRTIDDGNLVVERGRLVDFLAAHGGEAIDTSQVVTHDWDKEAAQALADVGAGANYNVDLNKDGKIEPFETTASEKAKTGKAKADAAQSGGTEAAAKASIDKQTGDLTIPSGGLIPEWVRSQFGGVPTNAQTAQMKDEWNATHPSEQISTADQLWDKLKAASPDHQELVNATIDGRDPIVQQVYNIGSTAGMRPGSQSAAKDVTIDQTAFAIAGARSPQNPDGLWGQDQRGLGEIVRAAARAGLMTPGGNAVAWQPLASLYKMTLPKDAVAPTPFGGHGRKDLADERAATSKATTLAQLAFKYKEGLKVYQGDATLAALYAAGYKGLVEKITKNAYGYLDPGDMATARGVLESGGWDTAALAKAGYATASPWYSQIFQSDANAYGSLGQDRRDELDAKAKAAARQNYITTNKADPETIKQSVVDMWQELFDAKPSDSQIAVVAGKINALVESRAAAAGAPDQNTTNVATDVGAQVRAAAQGSADYAKFYGHKPAGMSDAEYHAQFRGAAQEMLGNQAADPNDIRGGLATGDYQTTIGSIAGSSRSWNNSSFMQRLAQAAQTVNANT